MTRNTDTLLRPENGWATNAQRRSRGGGESQGGGAGGCDRGGGEYEGSGGVRAAAGGAGCGERDGGRAVAGHARPGARGAEGAAGGGQDKQVRRNGGREKVLCWGGSVDDVAFALSCGCFWLLWFWWLFGAGCFGGGYRVTCSRAVAA